MLTHVQNERTNMHLPLISCGEWTLVSSELILADLSLSNIANTNFMLRIDFLNKS